MFGQFNRHLELKWIAGIAAQFYTGAAKFQTNPDLVNFKLERLVDLRGRVVLNKEKTFKLMLIGSNKTNVFIDGPDNLVDVLIRRLPSYIAKPWTDIIDIELCGISVDCENFLIDNKCDPWIIENFEWEETRTGQETPCAMGDLSKSDKICVKCSNFMNKKERI